MSSAATATERCIASVNIFRCVRKARRPVLRSAGRGRSHWRVGLEWGEAAAPELSLTEYHGAELRETTLARCEAHGAWIAWLADGSDRDA